jgi:hypothetical protein
MPCCVSAGLVKAIVRLPTIVAADHRRGGENGQGHDSGNPNGAVGASNDRGTLLERQNARRTDDRCGRSGRTGGRFPAIQ